jgi:hypothetical protein
MIYRRFNFGRHYLAFSVGNPCDYEIPFFEFILRSTFWALTVGPLTACISRRKSFRP